MECSNYVPKSSFIDCAFHVVWMNEILEPSRRIRSAKTGSATSSRCSRSCCTGNESLGNGNDGNVGRRFANQKQESSSPTTSVCRRFTSALHRTSLFVQQAIESHQDRRLCLARALCCGNSQLEGLAVHCRLPEQSFSLQVLYVTGL